MRTTHACHPNAGTDADTIPRPARRQPRTGTNTNLNINANTDTVLTHELATLPTRLLDILNKLIDANATSGRETE